MKCKLLILLCAYYTPILAFSKLPEYRPIHPSANGNHAFITSEDIFGTRIFIENRMDHNEPVFKDRKVFFVYDHHGEKIYFTSDGLIYEQILLHSFGDKGSKQELEYENEEYENEENNPPPHYYITMSWAGCNPEMIPEGKDKQGYYFTYGSTDYNASAYKRILYKNVYPNIDIEYCLPKDKVTGIKYNVILHPGARINQIKMVYGGDFDRIVSDDGEVVVKTRLSDIIEHTPVSYDGQHKPVQITYQLKGNTIGFTCASPNQNTDNVVIDPWVTTVTTLTQTSCAYDIDYDNQGNVYIYGGAPPFKIAKYDASGVLQWTFGGTVVTPSWIAWGIYVGNFAVNRVSGKSYIAQGHMVGGTTAIRLNSSGNYDNLMTIANPLLRETWDVGVFCPSIEGEKIILFCGTTQSSLSAAIVNTVTGALSTRNFQPNIPGPSQDIVCFDVDRQGNIFVIYADDGNIQLDENICLINSAQNGNIWSVPSSFGPNALWENGNRSAFLPGPGTYQSNAFNCLASSDNYVFYYDGFHLAAYYKSNGGLIASITIPGAILREKGGIAADRCDMLYLGGSGSILTYSFTGTTFVANNPIPLGAATPTQKVYDIKLNTSNNLLYACGTGFVGAYPATLSAGCSPNFLATTASHPTICAGQQSTLNAWGANTIVWPSGLESPSLVVSPSVTTSYTVTGINYCGVESGLAVITVSVKPGPAMLVNASETICIGSSCTYSASGADSYTWSTGAISSSIVVIPLSNSSYTVVGYSNLSGCTSQSIVNVVLSPCAGINEMNYNIALNLFPNPANTYVILNASKAIGNASLTIVNALGVQMYSGEEVHFNPAGQAKIDVARIPKGLYLIVLWDGYSSHSIRFLKE